MYQITARSLDYQRFEPGIFFGRTCQNTGGPFGPPVFCMEGFERRLLAKPRWGFATAVAFPQKSESLLLRQKGTAIPSGMAVPFSTPRAQSRVTAPRPPAARGRAAIWPAARQKKLAVSRRSLPCGVLADFSAPGKSLGFRNTMSIAQDRRNLKKKSGRAAMSCRMGIIRV